MKTLQNENREDVLQELMEEFSNDVFWLAYSYVKDTKLAEDISQDVFYKCYKYLHQYKGEASIKSWLLKITANTSKNYIRNKNFLIFRNSRLLYEQDLQTGQDTERIVTKKEDHNVILEQILTLNTKYREVIFLYYFQEMKISEMKKVLKVNENTLKTRLARARAILKNKLSDFEEG